MASYFELPPQEKAPAANIEALPAEQRKQLGRMSLLSPAVTQLLDDLGQDRSDSDSEEGSQSADDTKHLDELTKKQDPGKPRQVKGTHTQPATASPLSPRKIEHSPNKKPARVKSPPERSAGGSSKPKQPHMARFRSLRSMLFSNTIEDKIKTITPEDCAKEEEAAKRWRAQHAQRQMPTRPKTPEKDAQGKESKGAGLGSRLKMSIRRMTTKDVTTMETLKEDGAAHDFSDHGSTASSDNEVEPYRWKPREADEESINHSDVEDLVRWVSRRDPPSDGEARAAGKKPAVTEVKDDGHDSMANSDVDDLVKWVSRKSNGPEAQNVRGGYSDASTESDSEVLAAHDSSDEEDADHLVRWISHREGPIAGPQREKHDRSSNSPKIESHSRHDSDVPELASWAKTHDGASGESGATTPALEVPEEPERGRPRSREAPTRPQARTYLTHDDVNDLVSWISRKDSKESPSKQIDGADKSTHITSKPAKPESEQVPTKVKQDALEADQDTKKKELGMSIEEGSLSHSDVKEIIEHVKTSDLSLSGTDPAVTSSSAGQRESGDLRTMRTNMRDAENFAAQDRLREARGEGRPIESKDFLPEQNEPDKKENERRSSLGHDDIDELVSWVSKKK